MFMDLSALMVTSPVTATITAPTNTDRIATTAMKAKPLVPKRRKPKKQKVLKRKATKKKSLPVRLLALKRKPKKKNRLIPVEKHYHDWVFDINIGNVTQLGECQCRTRKMDCTSAMQCS